jgi:hypothetical protein
MKWLVLFACLAAAPFWESKAPADWTETELLTLLTDSPWAQMMQTPGQTPGPPVQVYLATAAPMQQAEQERERRYVSKRPNAVPDEMTLEYRAWLKENRDKSIVIAIGIPKIQGIDMEMDTQKMQEECVMHVGRKKFKMSGHFPPTASDPFLRIAFPREVTATEKSVTFDLYIPGVTIPYRSAEFKIRDMIVNGKLEI